MDSSIVAIVTSPSIAGSDSPAGRLVRAAVRDLEIYGVESLSIERILSEAETSYQVLFQEFGGLDGLLDAARLALVSLRASESLDLITNALNKINTYEDVFTHALALATSYQSKAFKENRLIRSAIFGSTLHRPELRSALAEIQNNMTNSLTALLQSGIDRGLYRCAVSTRALAVFVQAFTAGQIIDEIDHTPTPPEEWRATINHALRSLILPPLSTKQENESL
jgi:AcrR family transcriptional regulator